MKKVCYTILVLIIILGSFQLASNAVINHANVTDSPVKLTYKCQYRNNSCTVFANTYPMLDTTYYKVVCTGSASQQKVNTRLSESDIKRQRFHYCTLDTAEN